MLTPRNNFERASAPNSKMSISPEDSKSQEFDREQAFVLYGTFCGDVERTAHALGVRPMDVLRVADEEKWNEKLKSIIELKNSNRPGDLERAINRALNFAQAHRFRLFLERMLHKLFTMTPEQAESYMIEVVVKKDGSSYSKLSTRPLADLAAALEKAHAMTYLALNDTTQDRTRRKEQSADDNAGGELHERIAAAMARVGASETPRAMLFDAQLAHAGDLKREQGTQASNAARAKLESIPDPPVHPADNDDH